METKNYIKEAERNLLRVCKIFSIYLDLLDSMGNFGNKYFESYDNENKRMFFEGLQKMREAILNRFAHQMKNLFMLASIGGEEAERFAREELKRVFSEDERYSVMFFLSKFGTLPGVWSSEDEREFRKQMRDVLDLL